MAPVEVAGLATFVAVVLFCVALFVLTSQPFVDHLTRWWVRKRHRR